PKGGGIEPEYHEPSRIGCTEASGRSCERDGRAERWRTGRTTPTAPESSGAVTTAGTTRSRSCTGRPGALPPTPAGTGTGGGAAGAGPAGTAPAGSTTARGGSAGSASAAAGPGGTASW